MKKFLTAAAAGALALGLATPSQAADIPCDTAQLIVPWKAGGGTHVIFSIFTPDAASPEISTTSAT